MHGRTAKPCVTATHRDLFRDAETPRCDVCALPLAPVHDGDDEGYAVRGHGLFVWYRGDERRVEERTLCPSCGTAVGLKALQRWEIEEDEG
jgi:hypothetical protein